MIPLFPSFKNLEPSDKDSMEELTKQFPPYCDFDFIDLWTYNPRNATQISTLDSNLIVKRADIMTGDLFYSFMGTNNTKEIIAKLLLRSKEELLTPMLQLIPEVNFEFSCDLHNYFIIKEDLDNFDYIFSVSEMADLEGSKYADTRNHISKFKRTYPNHNVQIMDVTQETTQQEIKNLFLLWERQKEKKRDETIVELTALEKLFEVLDILPTRCIGIYMEEKLIGFSTFNIAQDNYAFLSFIKADTSYKGIYEYLNHLVAKQLKPLGSLYINYEQDLGIPGLRTAKQRWHPVFFLKKYTIEEKI